MSTQDLARKLQLKPGQRIVGFNQPDGVALGLAPDQIEPELTGAAHVLVFARDRAQLDASSAPAVGAAQRDRLTWIAYPKSGQLGTDLNRDRTVSALETSGLEPVRQIALDDAWSALRFRTDTSN